MRFVIKSIHAYLDYPVAIRLLALPFLLGLGGSLTLALIAAPVAGVAALTLTIFTDHHLGLVRVLPYRLHLAVDLAVEVRLPELVRGRGLVPEPVVRRRRSDQ